MGKLFGLVGMLVALYVVMTLYTKGIEGALRWSLRPHRASQQSRCAHRDSPDSGRFSSRRTPV